MTAVDGKRRGSNHERSFVDDKGTAWRVFEHRVEGEGQSLVFECDSAYRRVRDFPADWYTLPGDALCRLSWGR